MKSQNLKSLGPDLIFEFIFGLQVSVQGFLWLLLFWDVESSTQIIEVFRIPYILWTILFHFFHFHDVNDRFLRFFINWWWPVSLNFIFRVAYVYFNLVCKFYSNKLLLYFAKTWWSLRYFLWVFKIRSYNSIKIILFFYIIIGFTFSTTALIVYLIKRFMLVLQINFILVSCLLVWWLKLLTCKQIRILYLKHLWVASINLIW